MTRTITVFGAALALLAIPASAMDFSLKGKWKADIAQPMYCDKLSPAAMEHFNFEILDAPYLNSAVSSFNLADANVTGTVTMQMRIEHQRYPATVISGLLIAEIVRNSPLGSGASGKAAGSTLKGYIVTREQYGTWIENKKQRIVPDNNLGEIEMEILGDAFTGYALTGEVRSGEACPGQLIHVSSILVQHFNLSIRPTWSARVTLKKQ